MRGLRPFFPYYGAKWRAALHYPQPEFDTIIEPFAGSACYSVRNPEKRVILVERDPVIASIWFFLIHATPKDIRELPLSIKDLSGVSPPARNLIGFWLNRGTATPSKSPSSWMRAGKHATSFWGKEIRERLAVQVGRIKHWEIIGDFHHRSPDIRATWFIDPPYQSMGRHYKYNQIDYGDLARWCRQKKGQVIVCEQEGATWLPFREFRPLKSTLGKSREVVWTNA